MRREVVAPVSRLDASRWRGIGAWLSVGALVLPCRLGVTPRGSVRVVVGPVFRRAAVSKRQQAILLPTQSGSNRRRGVPRADDLEETNIWWNLRAARSIISP